MNKAYKPAGDDKLLLQIALLDFIQYTIGVLHTSCPADLRYSIGEQLELYLTDVYTAITLSIHLLEETPAYIKDKGPVEVKRWKEQKHREVMKIMEEADSKWVKAKGIWNILLKTDHLADRKVTVWKQVGEIGRYFYGWRKYCWH